MHQRGTDKGPTANPSLNVVHTPSQRYTHPPPAAHQSMPPPSDDKSIETKRALENIDRLSSQLNVPGNCPVPVPAYSVATSSQTPSLRPQNGQVQSTLAGGTASAALPARIDPTAYIDMPAKADETRQPKELCFNFVKGSCKTSTCSRLHPSPIITSKICTNSLGKPRCQNKDCRLLHGVRNLDDLLRHALPLIDQSLPPNSGEGPMTSSLASPSITSKSECTLTSQTRSTPIGSLMPSYDDLCHAFILEKCNNTPCRRIHSAPEITRRICRNYLLGLCNDRLCRRLHPPLRKANTPRCVNELRTLATSVDSKTDTEKEQISSCTSVLTAPVVPFASKPGNPALVTNTAVEPSLVKSSCLPSHEGVTTPSTTYQTYPTRTICLPGIPPVISAPAAQKDSSQMSKVRTMEPNPSLPTSKDLIPEGSPDSTNTDDLNNNDKSRGACHRYLDGHCNKGLSCNYRHPPVSECRSKHPSVMAATLNMKSFCSLAVLGECSSPDCCGLPHVPQAWTNGVCKNFLRGTCRVPRTRCMWLHPPSPEITVVPQIEQIEDQSFHLNYMQPAKKPAHTKSSQSKDSDSLSQGSQVANSTNNGGDPLRNAVNKSETTVGKSGLPVDQITTWAGVVDISGWDCSSSSSDECSDLTDSSFVTASSSTTVFDLSGAVVKSVTNHHSAQSSICNRLGCKRKGKCTHEQVDRRISIDSSQATLTSVDHSDKKPLDSPAAPPGLGPPRKENIPGTSSSAMLLEKSENITAVASTSTSDVPRVPDISLSDKSLSKSENTPTATSTSTSIVPRGSHLTLTLLDHVKVHYGPGFDVVDVTTAFESRWVFLDDVPGLVKDTAIIEFLKPFGTVEEVQRPVYPPVDNNPITIKVRFAKPTQALKAAVLLTGLDFFGCTISARLAINNTGGGNGMLRDSTVKVVWDAPARVGYAGYGTLQKAEDVVRIVNGSEMDGYQVKASLWHGSPCVGRHNVIFENLPPQCTLEMLERYAPRVDLILQRPNYTSVDRATASVRRIMTSVGEVIRFNNPAPPVYGRCVAWIEYASPAAAKKACLRNGRKFAFLGDGKLSVRHVCELSYKMPAFVFHRLSRDVDMLRDTYAKDGVSIIVHKHPDERNPAVSVKIASENGAELSRPKADFERMLRGEDVTRDGKPIWDAFFRYPLGQQFLSGLQCDYPGLEIQSNPGRKTITLFGHAYVRSKAREAIIRRFDILHAKRIRSLELPGPLFAAFMRAEFLELQRTLGYENVWMLLDTKRLYVRGDDATFQQAKFLVSQAQERLSVSSPSQQRKSCVCPVCFDEPTEPIILDCRHSWCRSCLVDYLNSAKDNRMFPLTCLGNDASCSQRIPLYTARDILDAGDYEALATAALMVYVNTRPNEFFYCPSPDCPQFYRSVRQMSKQAVIQCPSCLARICPHCHVFAHDSMTCAERDSQGDRLFREWTATHDVKPCPGCKAPIERAEGCNHMTCARCETHICWVCLRTFEKGQGIYDHMRIAHGGIGL